MQDRAITEIGKIALEEKGDLELYALYIENMFPGRNYDMILGAFSLTQNNDQYSCTFTGVDTEKVGDKNFQKFAYRKGSARGGDITFTTKFGDITKKFNTLVTNQVKSVIEHSKRKKLHEEEGVFRALQTCLIEKKEEILIQLAEVQSQLDKKEQQSSGFSIKLLINNEEKYLENFDTIREIILQSGTSGKSEKYGVKSEGKNQMCSICEQKKDILHGFASPYKYATVDKPGMVSGFFNQKNNWKNYPICSECALFFEFGKNYISNHLSNYFFGNSYFAIPKTVIKNDSQNLKAAINRIRSINSYALDTGNRKKIGRVEDYMMRAIGAENNYFTLNLLFFEENQTTKAIKIKLMLEEILPSRFRQLFIDAPKVLGETVLYRKAISIKGERYDLEFSFSLFKDFFSTEFYEIINKVFKGITIPKELLYTKFMSVIRSNYNKSQTSDGYVEQIYITFLKAHLLINYLGYLKIIESTPNQTLFKMDNTEAKMDKKKSFDEIKFYQFVSENRLFFDADYKIGIFTIGILVRLLLNLQYTNLKNTPFEKKLKGYHLNPSLLKTIYMEALEKISQYSNFFAYQELRDIINKHYLMNSPQINTISNNELSFYFVGGLEFGKNFKTEQES